MCQPRRSGRAEKNAGFRTSGNGTVGTAMLGWLAAAVGLLAAGCASQGPAAPLGGTGYSAEDSNFLCARYFGRNCTGDSYRLPCRPPADEYRSPLLDQFVITAWWPPTRNARLTETNGF